MIHNYFKIAWRNLKNNKFFSAINIFGLAAGMAVALLIGLWVYDELSFNKQHKNYNNIVRVLEHVKLNGGTETFFTLPLPLSAELRSKYGSDFKNVASIAMTPQIIAYGDKVFTKNCVYAEPQFPEMMTLQMLKGTQTALSDPSAVLLNESLAKTIFGDEDPVGKTVKVNNAYTQQVKGVYKDIPKNSTFNGIALMMPMEVRFPASSAGVNWYSSSFDIYAQLNPGSDEVKVSEKIKNIVFEHTDDEAKPSLFLYPMSRLHLYEFKKGTDAGGRIQFVWLFGIIGVFVLILACINFINLSTARSEKRAKEVGIRKTIGSVRVQLINQFLSESLLIVILAFVLAIGLVAVFLPWFNKLSDNEMVILWGSPVFWFTSIAFIFITGLLAGGYPALYLSSFKPVRVLKGTFKAGRLAAIPRKVLVVVQFTVSVIMIIGTIIVYSQIQYARDRPVGYTREGLVTIPLTTNEIQGHYQAFRNDLVSAGIVASMSLSSSPATGTWSWADNLEWKGKDPNRQSLFGTIAVDPDFGKVVGWEMKEGRNFSNQFATDSFSFIFNEAAIRLMGLKTPVDEIVKWHGKNWHVIGVVKDMVMNSPFDPVVPAVFMMNNKERTFNVINVKINPALSTRAALSAIETVFKRYAPATPFEYKFADTDYALKFSGEERIGKLASVFAILAIFISCLGLFGLASFVAEKRTREIGVRKVLGASVFNLWRMLSKDFVVLVIISCVVAIPVSYYYMNQWLHKYEYRTDISWWIFAAATGGALIITLATVSFQAIRAALANPVRSLRTE